ncbi:MAG: acetyl-CoA decarbonylase/synthase complex subunit alpha/beta [Candidatus Humimicrobiia bacterium]
MSKIIASAAIRGAHQKVKEAQEILDKSLEQFGPKQEVEFPNTGYYLPIIYGITGIAIKKLGDMQPVLDEAKKLLPPVPKDKVWLPYLGNALDAGMATLFAEEIMEAIKYIMDPNPVQDIWLGAAEDMTIRERGIEFVDGSAPGFAAVIGATPTNDMAVKIARELQQKSIYILMSGNTNGKAFAEQLNEEGVDLGWETRLVPFGKEIGATVYSLGFATRVALTFGGVKPGDYRRVLLYNKNRIFAFVLALGEVTDEKYANAAGAINFGFPTIADTDIPSILPRGVCTYEHVVPSIKREEIVSKGIEVRGLKLTITEVPVPIPYGPAFEGERVRKEDMHAEFGGTKSKCLEFLYTKDLAEVEDGKIELIGPDVDTIEPGTAIPLAIIVEVAGRDMQPDFEPILERQIHHFTNYGHGLLHIGQRDISWIRISKDAYNAGFRIEDIGKIIHAKLHSDFGAILDKVQVKLYTDEKQVEELLKVAKPVYKVRDDRIGALTDESVDTFYSCTLCQSFAPNHVCIISPERPGLCGAYNWLDGKASNQINPTGPNQPVKKGELIDKHLGQWKGVNEFVYKNSHQTLATFSAYSMINDPMTSCGCFETIVAVLPMTGGVMVVPREHPDMTPCGMKFSTLAGSVGGGVQTPGFIGVSKFFLSSKKFIKADGGFKRLVWMPKMLKEEVREAFQHRADELEIPDFLDKIATEENAVTEEEVLNFIQKVGHPVLEMESMF